MRIDSHQHFWKFDPIRDSWINANMNIIQRDFLPIDLEPVLKASDIDGCVAIQASQSEDENHFLCSLVSQNPLIKGVVGWVDLTSEAILDRLDYFSTIEVIKGFRHVLQSEPERDFMLRTDFKNGIKSLTNYDFTYDILIFADQLKYAKILAATFQNQRFVLDHIAKPDIKSGNMETWKKDIQLLAREENVCCKISGMVTEADWKNWKHEDFTPFLDVVVESFGIDRIMYGSDWPVCLVAASYQQMLDIVQNYFLSYSENEKSKIFGDNASKFYHLN